MRTGRLLFPAIRWKQETGFDHERDRISAALELGVGGFIIFGGRAEAVRSLTGDLQRRSRHPLLIGADLERGAGQQFAGATPLPPLAAIGELGDPDITRWAGALTGREALALGVNWVYAPMADLDVEAENPIVGTRAFSGDPREVKLHVAAWIDGCNSAGALTCVKHFPGHGRTTADSHAELPWVRAERPVLDADLDPFASAFERGVDSVMTAHVVYPALDPEERPATLSPPILRGLLREEMGFEGIVVTDALDMKGLLENVSGEPEAAVLALKAGCDALLHPTDTQAVAQALDEAIGDRVMEARLHDAIERIRLAAERAEEAAERAEEAAERANKGATNAKEAGTNAKKAGDQPEASRPSRWGRPEDRKRAAKVAARTLVAVRGDIELPGGPVRLLTVDDDVGGPFPPPSREPFAAALRAGGVPVRGDGEGSTTGRPGAPPPSGTGTGDPDDLPEPGTTGEARLAAGAGSARAEEARILPADDEAPAGRLIVAVYADIRAWKGRPGISAEARKQVEQALVADPQGLVVLFGHPRLAADLPGEAVLAAWGGEPLMQEAAARRLSQPDSEERGR